MDCIVHGVAKIQTCLSNFHYHYHRIEKASPTTCTLYKKSTLNKKPKRYVRRYTMQTVSTGRQELAIPILKEISPGISLEGMMLKLKLQYFGHLMRRVDSLEKTLMLGGIGGRRRRGWQRMRWLDMSLSKLRELVTDREAWSSTIHGVAKSWTRLSDWTELNWCAIKSFRFTIRSLS